MTGEELSKIAIFRKKEIRKVIHNNEWWFSVVDIAQALTDQSDFQAARKYWNKLAERLRIDGALSASSYCSSRASVSGHIHHANSFHLRKKLALWK